MSFKERAKILSILAGVLLLIAVGIVFPVILGVAIAGVLLWWAAIHMNKRDSDLD